MNKRIRPQEVKGKLNEERAITLTRSLKEIVPWVRKVKKAGTRLDRAGVDVKVFIESPYSNDDVIVLMQVKSSRAHAKLYARTHPECIEAGVILTVVNDRRSDEHIKATVLYALDAVRTNPDRHERFERLYATARHTPLPPRPRMRKNRKVLSHLECSEECVCESANGRGDCEFPYR